MYKINHFVCAAITGLLFSGTAFAKCDYPEKSSVPNGATASEQEMIEGQRGVKKFMAEMDEYLACLDEESKAETDAEEDPKAAQQKASIAAKKHNAAVDDLEQFAASFNEQVRAFKDRED